MELRNCRFLLVVGILLEKTFCANGIHTRSQRNVGGSLVKDAIPWQVLLLYSDSVLDGGLGGGALIAERWVLTSGRNLFLNKTPQPVARKPTVLPKVYLGVTDRKQMDKSSDVEVEKVIVHPGFQNISSWDNDLALIKLKEPVTYSEKVMPIPLPEAGQHLEEKAETQGVIASWGLGSDDVLEFTIRLKHLTVPVVSWDDCRDKAPAYNHMFCTGMTQNQENVCIGDAGGALAVLDPIKDKVYAAGILSYDKCCRNGEYAFYTKLSDYLPWIHSVLREDSEQLCTLRTDIMRQLLSGVESA